MDKTIFPGEVAGEIEPPSSKSYAQRVVAASFLAGLTSSGANADAHAREIAADCDDTAAALRVVEALTRFSSKAVSCCAERRGESEDSTERTDSLENRGGVTDDCFSRKIDIGESGLCARLFTPIAALSDRPITITGHGSIMRRPMTMMIEPLRALGVEVADNQGFLPITVRGPLRGGEVEIDGSTSSQFLTGLLMALPLAEADTTVRVRDLASKPYIDMTLEVMERYGVEVDHRDYEEFYIPNNQQYTPADFTVEGDWSAASCLLVAGAIAGGAGPEGEGVTVTDLLATSLQADTAIVGALSLAGACVEQSGNAHGDLAEMLLSPERDGVQQTYGENTVKVYPGGGLRGFFFDATNCPDLFPALAALASACDGTSTIVGTNRLIHKESNRAEAIRDEFGKLGIEVDLSEKNVMKVTGVPVCRRSGADFAPLSRQTVTVDSHGDHRMAMSLAVTALRAAGPVTITGAECVSKSYARFWDDFDFLTNRAANNANNE